MTEPSGVISDGARLDRTFRAELMVHRGAGIPTSSEGIRFDCGGNSGATQRLDNATSRPAWRGTDGPFKTHFATPDRDTRIVDSRYHLPEETS